MSDRIIIRPSTLTDEQVEALRELLREKREAGSWPEKDIHDLEDFLEDYQQGRDRLEEEFLKENPDKTPEDWRDHLDKPREFDQPDFPQNADASPQGKEGLEQNMTAAPRTESMLTMARAPIADPGLAPLVKDTATWTEGEMKRVLDNAQGSFRGWRSGDPLKAHSYERVQDWHVGIYGDGPQAHDGGKPIEPKPIRPVPETESPASSLGEPRPAAAPKGFKARSTVRSARCSARTTPAPRSRAACCRTP